MAGTFTHWMVVEEALDIYNRLPQKHPYFFKILKQNHFICLGAVGPDYPYLSELLGGFLRVHSWADRMHYENTSEFIGHGIKSLLGLNGDAFDICLAWLCGFTTHIVADSVIHPVVQAIVGPYIFNSGEHRHCEMIQDSYIFNEIKKVELGYAEYVGLFKMCSDPDDKDKINPNLKALWTETLKASHPTAVERFDKIDPDNWHENFLSRIDSAADPLAVFRHFGEEKNLVYKKTADIDPEERRQFIEQVMLPGNKTGTFRKDAFDKAVNVVIDTWDRLFVDVEKKNPDGINIYLKNWNLDTGVDEDRAYFWP
ncbi:MAG: zinc dependent phospholipase C family protein [Syntrophorhabdaceae bacterium]|nr:zinc dependent phospholipase C family protein [Syntrophorhabdaceae bacterium]